MICREDVSWFGDINAFIPSDKLVTWSLDNSNSKYKIQWTSGSIKVNDNTYKTSLKHSSEKENLTHCIVTSLEIGLSPGQIQDGIERIKPIPMRLELKKGINDCFILDDTYNNDLIGLKTAMDYLEAHKQNEKKTLILSDILHSGKTDDDLYNEVSELVESYSFDRIIGVGRNISKAKDHFKIQSDFFDSTDSLINNLPRFEKEMVLVKGARDFHLDSVVHLLEDKHHGTVLEVNFEALRHNLNQYRNLLSPQTQLMVMVKANAYGSGILEVSNFLQHEKVDMLGVAYVDEAIQLRKNGIDIPIMIMNPQVESFNQFEDYKLESESYSISHLEKLLEDTRGKVPVHLKIDTGMHRLGFTENDIPILIDLLKTHSEVQVASIFTHFSSSDDQEQDSYTLTQAKLFEKIYEKITSAIGYSPLKHACNSTGIVRWPQYHYDIVRLGVGLHGFDPTNQLDLRFTSQLKTEISQIHDIKKGQTIGYSRKGVMPHDGKIAVLPIGYEDGFSRAFGNGKSKVDINGKMCLSIGNICMDMMMVDVTDTQASVGDEVVIFGSRPTIIDLAKTADTIPYEILTNIGPRVKRVFVSE